MGIFIYISLSKSVSKKEWKEVYDETLQLVDAFPLAERRKVACDGIDTICFVKTVERQDAYGRNGEKTRTGWFADGDYETMRTAERYCLTKDYIDEKNVEVDAGDAILGMLPSYLDYDWKDPLCSHCYDIWGSKTQGEPYHMYLLAIACLIEARLGEKAFVYGDITRGQCKKAVELANLFLDNPIDIPCRCDVERFWKRVSKLPLTDVEKLIIFENLYLGTKDAAFGNRFRNICPEQICYEYWKNRFCNKRIGTIGFSSVINDYLLWGFDLERLCRLVEFEKDENDTEEDSLYEKFVKRILDAKLYLKDKNCEDILEIDQEEEHPYSIYTLMAQFAFAGAKNDKVDRYIPLEQIRDELKRGLGDRCDVDAMIDSYLENTENEEDLSEKFHRNMDKVRESIIEKKEKYDIYDCEGLIYYEKGDSMHPAVKDALKDSLVFYLSLNAEEDYKLLMNQTAEERCRWLIDYNRCILLRDKEWIKIFTDIKENKDSFRRYYPMVRVKVYGNDLLYMVRAIVLNDVLYEEYGAI